MPQFLALNVTVTADNADEVIAKLKAIGATAKGEAAEGVSALDTAASSLTSVLGELGLALGVGEVLRKTFEAANEGELATNRLAIAFRNAGLNVANFTDLISKSEQPLLAMGQATESDLNAALATMLQLTGDLAGSLQRLHMVQELANTGQYDMHTAAVLVARAMEGQWIMLQRQFPDLKNATDKWAEFDHVLRGFTEGHVNTLGGQLTRVGVELRTMAEHAVEAAGGATTLKEAVDPLVEALRHLDSLLPQIEQGFHRMFAPVKLLLDTIMHPQESLAQMWEAIKDIFTGDWSNLVTGQTRGAHMLPTVNIGPNAAAGQATGAPGPRTMPLGPALPVGQIMDIGSVEENPRAANLPSEWASTISGAGASVGTLSGSSGVKGDQLMNQLNQIWAQYLKGLQAAKTASAAMTESVSEMWSNMFDKMGDAMQKAFEGKKIGGVLKALGQSILSGFGQMFEEQGKALLVYGVIMTDLIPELSNPFTSGPAALAAGAALVALGAAFNAIAQSGAAPGSGTSGSSSSQGVVSPHGVSSTSYLLPSPGSPFAPGEKYPGLVQPVFNVIGSGDPRAMRDMAQLLANMVGRGYTAPGIAGT